MSVATMIGMLGAGAMSSAGQLSANRANIKQQVKNNALSMEMADSAHQREVADLLLAGINPILTSGGAGASVPSLGVADQKNAGQGLADAIGSAADYISDQYKANVESTKADTAHTNLVNDAQAAQNKAIREQAEADVNSAKASQLRSQLELDATEELLGWCEGESCKNGTVRVRDPQAYKAVKGLVKEGITSDMKNRANANLRANIGLGLDAIDKVSGIGFKGAAAKAAAKRASRTINQTHNHIYFNSKRRKKK